MKLYCVINDKQYEIIEGATFAEEYNETLDSGTIIIDQVPRIENLEPFDDVYIYDEDTNGNTFYKHMLVDTFQEELNNLNFGNDSVYTKLYKYKIQLFSETKRLEKVILPNISITQPVDKDKRRSVWEYLNVYLDLYSPKIKVITNDFTWRYEKKYSFSDFHNLPVGYKEVQFLQSTGTQWIRSNIQIQKGDRIIIEYSDFEPYESVGVGKYGFGQNHPGSLDAYFQLKVPDELVSSDITYKEHKTGNKREYVFTSVPNNFGGYFGLFCTTEDEGPLGEGPGSGKIYYVKHYRDNILVANLIPCIRESDGKPGFYDLEGEHTFYTNMGSGEFLYKAKRHPAHFNYNSVHDLFADVDAPEMSLTNPTLRDVISQLMLTKDCIPVVHDDVIDYIDVSERHGKFITDPNYVNFIHSGMTSEEFSTEARREYSGALSQENTCKMTEYLGFRDSQNALLTLDSIVLETRYPIYKINKIYMCYYKRAQIYDPDPNHLGNFYVRFLCKQDITDLVTQNVTRQALSLDPVAFRNLIGTNSNPVDIQTISTKDISKFKICTVGFDIGSNRITGWSDKYTYFTDTAAWFKSTQTVLENIIGFCDKKTPYGYKKAGVVVTGDQYVVSTSTNGLISIDTGGVYDNASISQKAVFFQIEYDAMFGGAIVHSKDYKDKDDLVTVDNCSSSLTVLEADGLFEKEKMNRLGNRQYNIQARYEGENAYSIMNGSTCNHILGSYYESESENIDDVIIYHKEYQIYDNVILANYTGTYDYVLKNYFTSVFAKLRTYNLATYSESVVRAENYKEYVVLSDEKATYEDNTLMYNNLSKYITCFSSPFSDLEPFKEMIRNQINFGYIQSKFIGSESNIDNSRAFCDINTFCSGYSMCVNLKMYDNVTQGVYIKEANVSNDNKVGSSQEWSIAVDNVEDAFQEKMAFGFGHLYQEDDDIPNNDLDPEGNKKQAFVPERSFDSKPITDESDSDVVASIYNNKLLKLPNFNNQKYIAYNSAYTIDIGNLNGLIIYKDNKEIIDYTFQFEVITNSKNVFFSSYFTKLNDMSGVYQKYYATGVYSQYWGRREEYNFPFQIDWSAEMSDSKHGKLYLYVTAKKLLFVNDYSPYDIDPVTEGREFTKSPNVPINYWFIPIGIVNWFYADYRQYWINRLTIDSNNSISVSLSRSERQRQDIVYIASPDDGPWWITDETTEALPPISLNIYKEDNEYYYLRAEIETIEIHPNVGMKIEDANRLNNVVELIAYSTQGLPQQEEYLKQKRAMTKNMFAIVSSEEIKKEIIYDSYLTTYTPEDNRKTFSGINILGLPDYMTVVNTDDSGGQIEIYPYISMEDMFSFVPVSIDLSIPAGTYILYDTISFPENILNFKVNFSLVLRNPDTNEQETKYFSEIIFENGEMKFVYRYNQENSLKVYDTTNGWVDINYQYLVLEGGNNYDFAFRTWLEDNTDDYDCANIPTIHVGNKNLASYPAHKSIQFWYLDNNGEGAGRLHFVFGVNTEKDMKDVYVSVATRRSPYVYTQDHKHIIGKIKQMNALNYVETNEIDLNGGGDVYLNEPVVSSKKIFEVNLFVNNEFFTKIKIDENQDMYYINDSGEEKLVYSNNAWVNSLYKHILIIGSEFKENTNFVQWLQNSSYQQFTVENIYAGQNSIYFSSWGTGSALHYDLPKLEFSKDRVSWKPYAIGRNLLLEEGEKIYFRGNKDNYFYLNPTNGSGAGVHFNASQNFKVSGRLMSLIDPSSESINASSRYGDGSSRFQNLFKGCSTLINADDLLVNATALGYRCYEGMFEDCTNLTSAAFDLPALTLSEYKCYARMFAGCSNLSVTPNLLFTYISALAVCEYMFYQCESLVIPPAILSTNTTQECYQYMFFGCVSLAQTPTFAFNALEQNCFHSMFYGCSSLTIINIDFSLVTAFEQDSCAYMFANCTSLTASVTLGLPTSTTGARCMQNMFSGCTSLIKLGRIYPKNLASSSCNYMFYKCTSLEVSATRTGDYQYAYPFPATPGSSSSLQYDMFTGTGGSYTDYGDPGTTYYLKYEPVPDQTPVPEIEAFITFNSNDSFTLGSANNVKIWDGTLEYSTNKENWSTWDGTSVISSISDGEKHNIYLRGINNTKISGGTASTSRHFVLTGSNISCTGNIETLLDYATVSQGGHPQMANYCFAYLFYDCSNLVTVPDLPSRTTTEGCYYGMFRRCSSLIAAPELSALLLSDYCYYEMFRGCSNLVTAPITLPATTLHSHCYDRMFYYCSSLVMAPTIAATEIQYVTSGIDEYCCSEMFANCTSLVTAPNLNILTLSDYCYFEMFYNCTALVNAPVLSATTLAGHCYDSMFFGCTALVNAPALLSEDLKTSCYERMFLGCTALVNAPALPALIMWDNCYYEMFRGCSSLITPPALPSSDLSNGSACYRRMFYNCTNLSMLPQLPATTLSNDCYANMFDGCSKIKISDAQTGEYQNVFRIPKSGSLSYSVSGATTDMFINTGGTFTGTPTTETVYYTSNTIIE